MIWTRFSTIAEHRSEIRCGVRLLAEVPQTDEALDVQGGNVRCHMQRPG